MVQAAMNHSGTVYLAAMPGSPRPSARGLSQTEVVVYTDLNEEHDLLEQVQEICLNCCQGAHYQAEVISCQSLPPEAISLVVPPERAWLVRLHVTEREWSAKIGEIEAIVVLRSGELHILFR